MNSLKKILLIDDDPIFGDTIQTALSPRKYKIIHAPTSISGIHQAFQLYPDMIFYNTNLDPLDGSEVFKALQLTSSLSHIPVVFYNDKDETQITNYINNNENGIPAKNQNKNKVTLLMKNKDGDQRKNSQDVSYDFNTLFQLSPNGMFIFDSMGILFMNQILMDLINAKKNEVSAFKLENLFDKTSSRNIKQWMKNYLKNDKTAFNHQVILKDKEGENFAMNLRISELKETEGIVHFLGTFQALEKTNSMYNYQLAQEVCNLLKRENMEVSESLEKKITHAIKLRALNEDHQKKSFFTKRENEVLRLSMEGLSIKVIADKLALSTRTVEKYRTKLMLKSGAKNIVEVIVFSIKNNLLKI